MLGEQTVKTAEKIEAACDSRNSSDETETGRDPEERIIDQTDKSSVREKMLDKTLADSFPTSDPPSSIPDPAEDDSFA
jgi:hypothetical protein